MPIKFRCRQCRQFLGISRSMAGKLVDCPTCGRMVRVPQLDGRVDPLPEPELDLEDSELAQALDELAMIGQEPADDAEPPLEPDKAPQAADVIEPTPLPEPVPIEPPLPAEPVAKPELPPPPPGTAAGDAAQPQNAAVGLAFTTASVEGELAGLAALSPGEVHARPARDSAGLRRWRSVFSTTVLLTIGCIGVVMFGLGYLAGRAGNSGKSLPALQSDGRRQANSENGNTPLANFSNSARLPAVTGRISFKNGSGDSRPDRGARVIVFPQKREGEAKLSIVGFRAGDSPADSRLAAASLQALGGGLAVVDEEGNFEIALPGAGLYHILVLSHYQPRDEEQPLEPPLESLLESYFDRPEQLLGRVSHHFSQVRYKGEGTEIWDHSFERAL